MHNLILYTVQILVLAEIVLAVLQLLYELTCCHGLLKDTRNVTIKLDSLQSELHTVAPRNTAPTVSQQGNEY